MLRDYQQRSIDLLYDWLRTNKGHPCLELPTGAGKSHIVAALCKDAVQSYPGTRILMITNTKELVEQNAEKMRQHWPNAPLGVVCASLGKRQFGRPITFGSIGSVARHADKLAHIDLCIVDESHGIHHKDEGQYRNLITALGCTNNHMRVIGLTATPYRMGHGLITDGDAIFDDIITPVTVEELILRGYLSPLRSKVTGLKYDPSSVHKRGGDFIESELAAAVDTDGQNEEVVREVLSLRENRKRLLFFCTGVIHAVHMRDTLRAYGIDADCVTGDTPKTERERILAKFKEKNDETYALTNANVLTTGFDAPDIDLIAMCRPTLSPGLYVQMAGRGLRLKSHTDHCLVLDFAGVVETHGPITAVQTPEFKAKKEGSKGEAPCKVCESCFELVATSAKVCPTCGAEFPAPEPKSLELRSDDIMGMEDTVEDITCRGWYWRVHNSKKSGLDMYCVEYHGDALTDPTVQEYICVKHDGWAKKKADRRLAEIADKRDLVVGSDDEMQAVCELFNNKPPPRSLTAKKNGRFYEILTMDWTWPEVAEKTPETTDEEDDTWQTEIPF